MRKIFVLLLILGSFTTGGRAQTMALQRGVLIDSLPINDSIANRLRLYLPADFKASRTWPLLFICNLDGEEMRTIRYMKSEADKNGYILASSDAIIDSTSLTNKLLVISKDIEKVKELLPIDNQRVYTAGYDKAGQLAVLVPMVFSTVAGVLSMASILPNTELIDKKKQFDYVGIMGRADFQYLRLREEEELLNQRKIPNHILFHSDRHQWPDRTYIDLGMQVLTLRGMKKKGAVRDTAQIRSSYEEFRNHILQLERNGEMLLAMDMTAKAETLFDDLTDTEWLTWKRKSLRGDRTYKDQKRDWERVLLNEMILVQDFIFYLDEDVLNFNLNNLGWWNHQMDNIQKYQDSPNKEEQLLGIRLEDFVNALVEEYIDISGQGPNPDDDALIFLYMLKTITAPAVVQNYLNVISLTAKYGDFGTANFYLEELLKKEYKNSERLYNLPHTGLLKISPEFNRIILKYLGEARYPIEE
jgi:hypothetical protein